ncbi:MAG: hypothetical protein A2177_02085 [Spirochaetes bacterium RBG_13_68_11]|nr:MAG: hypothetical protein A2177_02085 [Spirochaetes bacterium RBG_13_68_11]
MKLRVVNLLLAAGIAILFTSCKEGNVYYTLENEVKVEDLSLPNDITLFDVTKIGTSYYAAAGKIWTVADTAAEWDINATITPPVSGGICTALVASPFGATLYGGFINGAGNLGLYESTAAPSFSGLSAVSDPIINGAQIALLKTINDGVNDWLVAVTARHLPGENFTFGIAAFNNLAWGTFDTSVRVSPEDQKPFNDIIWSTNFSRWYATSGTKLYTKAVTGLAGAFVESTPANAASGEEFTGLLEWGTRVYLSSRSGAVFYTSDGATWTRIEAPAISGTYPPLTRFAGPVDAGIVLVGSDGYGYYLLDTADLGGTDPLTRYPTTTSDLYMAAVQKLYFDSGKSRVFACTSMGGLWRGAVLGDGLGSIDWNLE